MIRSTLGKIKRYIAGDKGSNAAESKENKLLDQLVHKASVTRRINTRSIEQLDKSNETLFYINMVKNGQTVNTGEHEALTRIFTGQKMYVDTRDISVAPHLMLDGEWEPEITRVFRDYINPDSVVLDVGANFGYFGVIAGSNMSSEGRLLLVEANRLLIPYIEKSLSVNGLMPFASVAHVAIGDKEGKLKLNVLDGYMGSSSVLKSQDENLAKFGTKLDHTETVRSTSIDLLCKEQGIKAVDVIKIDIEGFEDVAYRGMKGIIKNSPKLKVFLEFTGMAYDHPAEFFKAMSKDFPHIYAVGKDSSLTEVTSYKRLKELAAGDWIMLVLSKDMM